MTSTETIDPIVGADQKAAVQPQPDHRNNATPSAHVLDEPQARWPLNLAVVLQLIVATGDGLAGVALALRVFQQTHSAVAVTAVLLAAGLPVVFLAPLSGLLLDRFRIGRLLVGAAVTMGLAAAGLAFTRGLGPTIALVALYGVGDSLLRPGIGASVPLLAGPTGTIRANGRISAATMAGTALGPMFAGVVSGIGGTKLALLIDAGSYAVAAVGLAFLRLGHNPHGIRRRAARRDGAESLAHDKMSAGVAYLRADRPLGGLVLMSAIMIAFTNISVVAELFLAEGGLHGGATGYALLITAWTAAMTIGTLAAGRLPVSKLAPAALIGMMVAGLGIAWAGVSPHLWMAIVAYGIGGLGDGIEVVSVRSLLNTRTPEHLSGRVFSAFTALTVGAASLGMAASAPLVAGAGARGALVAAGLAGAVAGVLGFAFGLRRAGVVAVPLFGRGESATSVSPAPAHVGVPADHDLLQSVAA
jgi:MFS family permease